MQITLKELQLYKKFDDLAMEILEMAKEVLPDKLIYLTTFTHNLQVILKLSDENSSILLNEGMAIDLEETVCNQIDFKRNQPLIFEDMSQTTHLDALRKILAEVNINAYLGVPIILSNGEPFGTLCSVDSEASTFSDKSIKMLQRIAKLFTYYLELERLAYRDFLTGLYNRQFLNTFFDKNSVSSGTLLFLDLDGFKLVNDQLGHDVGDAVLKEVASRLNEFITLQSGFAVRLGGDEFVLYLEDIYSRGEKTEQVKWLLKRLSSWETQLETSRVSVSIGIVSFNSKENNNLEELLKRADQALYRAKEKGKNTFVFFGDGVESLS